MALQACRKLMNAVEAIKTGREDSDDESDDEEEVAFTMADEDKVMTHMMDCVALLAAMQQEERQDIPVNGAAARMSRNKVFMAALSTLGGSLLNIDNKEQPMQTKNAAIDQLLKAFPVPNYTYLVENGRKGWLPLHWAVALASSDRYDVTETDVKALYELDPMAMQSKHVTESHRDGYGGFTPAHLLCMSPVVQCSMELIRSFSVCNPTAFGSSTTVSALNTTCFYGTPTVELLQHLLQLDSSQAKVRTSFNGVGYEHCPLGLLCFNLVQRADELPNAEDLVNCLLEVDKSKNVVGDAVFGCLDGYCFSDAETDGDSIVEGRNSRLHGMIEMLLKANPEGAKYRELGSDANILQAVCWSPLPSKLCFEIMQMVLALNKDAVQEADHNGDLPVHRAAANSDLEVVEFLLGLYPEGASMVTTRG
jgi:hypothetical protein